MKACCYDDILKLSVRNGMLARHLASYSLILLDRGKGVQEIYG